MTNFFILLFVTQVGVSALADSGYTTCYVRNGVAHAQLCSQTNASGSGTGSIVAYDKNGSEVFSDSIVIWMGNTILGCTDVATYAVPESAVSCSFDPGS